MRFWKRHLVDLPTVHFGRKIDFHKESITVPGVDGYMRIMVFDTDDPDQIEYLLNYRGPNGEVYEHSEPAQPPKPALVDLESMTKIQLTDYAEITFGIELDMQTKKADMIAAIKEAMNEPSALNATSRK